MAWLKLCVYKLGGGHSSGARLPCLRPPALSIAQRGFVQLYQRVTKTRNSTMKAEVVRELPSRLPTPATKPVSPTPASLSPAELSQRRLNQKVVASFSTSTAYVAQFKGFQTAPAGGGRWWPCRSHCGRGDATTTLGKASGAAPGKWRPGRICLYCSNHQKWLVYEFTPICVCSFWLTT